MASGRQRSQWPPGPRAQPGGVASAGSSPSTNGPSTAGAGGYGEASHANGSYVQSLGGSNGQYGPGAPGYPSHGQQSNDGSLSPRTVHSSQHMPGGAFGHGASQQSHGALQQHMEPSIFSDPRGVGSSNPSSNYYGGYGQSQGLNSSSYVGTGTPYGYSSSAPAAPQHQQVPHQAFNAAPWVGPGGGSAPSYPSHDANHYGPPKPASYGQAQSYKPSDGYMQHMNPMGGIVYPGQVYQPDHDQVADIKADGEEEELDGEDAVDEMDGTGTGGARKGKGQPKGTSDFVKKLFRMLDDTSYAGIVSWGPMGDSFIVKDMNDFTKHVLPRHFRHSNFASFVRQLNKYDFHKVKKPEDQGQQQHLGVDQLWEFRHPAFLQGREDRLENVKRKVPAGKKGPKKEGDDSPRDRSPTMPRAADAADKGAEDYQALKQQMAALTESQDQMTDHINNLTKQYQGVIGEMLTFQKNMVQQDQLMQNLIQYLMNIEADRKIEAGPHQSTSQGNASMRPQLENSDAFVSSRDAERLVSSFSDVAKESFSQMSEIAHRAARSGNATLTSSLDSAAMDAGMARNDGSRTSRVSDQTPLSPKSTASQHTAQDAPYADKGKGRSPAVHEGHIPSVFFHPPHHDLGQDDSPTSGGHKELFNVAANAVNNPSLAGFEGAGLRVFTVGTLQPRSSTDLTGLEPDGSTPATAALEKAFLRSSGSTDEGESKSYGINVPSLESLPAGMPKLDGRTSSGTPTSFRPLSGEESVPQEEPATPSEGGANMLRVRRSTYVPGWAVPPKVLVVDDDDVCRKLGSKFLQVFGCAIDVAVDGVTAVNKMNLEKYDLVLMDIVMPNLDGVSATSLIREFDPRTPIISMTSNSAPNELLSYMSSGMNDVLPKPFTKEGLLNMLEKHLIHLKTVQKMDEIPKALGLPPISDDMMQSVLSATAASAASIGGASSTLQDGAANPMAAMMGNGPEALRTSQEADGGLPSIFGADGEEGIVNPLAGMGFSDEEYISMLQNLIAAGAVSDTSKGESADSVANVMGVARGEGAKAGGSRSKESTPISHTSVGPAVGKKRPAVGESGSEKPDEKRSRFTELQV